MYSKNKTNQLYIETKSRRWNLLVQPTTHEKMKAVAKSKGISSNELANRVFKEYLERRGAEMKDILKAKSWDDILGAFEKISYPEIADIYNEVQEYIGNGRWDKIYRMDEMESLTSAYNIEVSPAFDKSDPFFITEKDGSEIEAKSISCYEMYHMAVNYLTEGWTLKEAKEAFEFASKRLY